MHTDAENAAGKERRTVTEDFGYEYESIDDIARGEGFLIDDDGHWVPIEDAEEYGLEPEDDYDDDYDNDDYDGDDDDYDNDIDGGDWDGGFGDDD